MAWWGTLIGSTLGFMLGGPLGLLLGSVVGRQFDTGRQRTGDGPIPVSYTHHTLTTKA